MGRPGSSFPEIVPVGGAPAARSGVLRRAGSLVASLAVSIGILALLFWQIDPETLRRPLAAMSLPSLAAPIGLFAVALMLNGLRLRALANGEGRQDRAPWFRLAALHQSLVMLAPGGLGDLTFPALAGRLAGLNPLAGIRTLLAFRIQDLWTLLVFGISALLLSLARLERETALLFAIVPLALGSLHFADDLTRAALRLGIRCAALAPRFIRARMEPRLARFASDLSETLSHRRRAASALLTLGAWTATLIAFHALFLAAGFELPLVHTILLLVGVNLVGAVALFTIAGLGVAEAGLAGLLMALGTGREEALALALVVRPASLICLLAACLLVGLPATLFRRGRSGSTPKSGRAAPFS